MGALIGIICATSHIQAVQKERSKARRLAFAAGLTLEECAFLKECSSPEASPRDEVQRRKRGSHRQQPAILTRMPRLDLSLLQKEGDSKGKSEDGIREC